ncbi:hypothetical protein [Bradyrhizobium japonicum]|uniref:hypothetical protein n=1 Tax=Bradyrhizobium japonicum TaxID=375 RepID=UPI0011DD2BF4|nr:hypothetical protein [Bradyrhizobium japonicum]MCD9113074.1 hypothetical protein [Bradyrhizobium japonicum]MCD9260320.1 hypothetical protein [Bradyrhizobium japonicum SEMIA 5079]MCD9824928.1 hypothetical protein [Bradyrhizobium japonicum]MCD9897831.1 hypothetical protein [Bradyrhizobium japonicum]MCD9912928.1 hypothetical protein [Bradyrhizobium japonicum]
MTLKSAAFLTRTLLVAIIVSQTCGPIAGNQPAQMAAPNQATTSQPASAPTMVAQGRCFNGRCY